MEARVNVRIGPRRKRGNRAPRDDLATLCAVLADPGRLAIVRVLARSERSAGDLAKESKATASATANRLATLESNGIVERRREGRRVIYRLKHPEMARQLPRLEALAAMCSSAVPPVE